MAAKRVAGISSITINGSSFALVDGLTYSPSSVRRETMTGLDGVHGYKELPVAGFIACTIRDINTSVADFNGMTAATVQLIQANGKQVIGSLMWVVDVQEVDASEGTFSVRFEGVDVVEIF
ncbi:phage tail tube protein [Paracraurococcus lichenis]|uniref:Phage tail tube protein n=1 Tax=Paracraurococcus lichenis TaxID=3064888 RepID=A0ABT9EDX5_9PROT|nr:phage tail tube protein [Paracraurococcus sp. LOR1-02]MDO9714299.1 phage tail tube protein [Paracraurococcus sp. LOR1-02]